MNGRHPWLASALLASALFCAPAESQSARVSIEAIPDAVWRNMIGKSWRAELPCASRDELALLRVPFWNFEGRQETGWLIVGRSVAKDVASAMQEIFERRSFPIAKMRLIDDYNGDDDASMADNNTSAFNCRRVDGTGNMSKHARGLAIDINPVQNPYIDGKGIYPPSAARYAAASERRAGVTGLIVEGDVTTRAFRRIGWSWGGHFRTIKDYQHFAK